MKVLILSITAGQGHNNTAKAIAAHMESLGAECCILDTYKYLNKLLGNTVSAGYLLSIENAKAVYSRAYRHFEKRKKCADDVSATRITNSVFCHKLKKYIDAYDPDVIITTHIFAAIPVDIIKVKYGLRAKTVGILTDFTFHPYWEEALHLDYIVVPNELLGWQARKKGLHDNQILPFGIPINTKFNNDVDRAQARRDLGLDEDIITVLLMSGSMGFGKISDTVRHLDELDTEFQLLVVCGNNEEEKRKIDSMRLKKRVVNFGYTDNIDVLMSAADCIITKPGGLTTSEALAKRLPMIIVNPIPGQEERNTEFLLNNGVAMRVSDTCPIDEVLYQFSKYPERLEIMKRSIDLIRKPDSTEHLCNFIIAECRKNN